MIGGCQNRFIVNLSKLVFPRQNIGCGGMDNHFFACQISDSHIKAVIGFHLVIHQARQCRVVVGASAAESVRQTDNGVQARQGVLQHSRRIMARGILGSGQFRVFLIFTFGYIIGIRQLIFQIPEQGTVTKNKSMPLLWPYPLEVRTAVPVSAAVSSNASRA